ncbi:hypothetical protein RMATCC62417_10501 [Rhizopus microsporus]|nr:hypothetical protein RMATCC62417_10501 [Rhizopus microsporus]
MASLKLTPNLIRPHVWARSLQQQPFIVPRIALSQVPKTTFLGIRAYSSKQTEIHTAIRDLGVIANYIPPETSPSITDFANWRLTKWRNLKNSVQNLLSVGLIKRKSLYDNWNSSRFLTEALETYKDMNDAFARGDREVLEEVCLDSMFSNLKNQIKGRSNVRWEWKYHGEVEAPKIVCIRCISPTGFSKHGFAIGQVTVKMFTKQSMAVYDKKNKLVGGDPNKVHNILEYIVFQKTISNPEDIWRVYGKVASPDKLIKQ